MKTAIYENYSAFLDRENKEENGVSQAHADANPKWADEKGNEGCWNSSGCSGCSRCSDCSGCSDCSDCSDCSRCSDCSDCSGCSDCSRCSDCSDCSGCSDCSDLRNARPSENAMPEIPVVPNIHQRLCEAVKATPKSLDMGNWHSCETTHCRGGWIITLAGEAGKKLEEATTTEFAAMQIYKASSPIRVSPVRFYETNAVAMADIERCAAEEAAL